MANKYDNGKYRLSDLIDSSAGWDWENEHVAESYINTTGDLVQQNVVANDIIESGTVLICAGPADLDSATSSTINTGVRIVPIGLIETAQISMNKPLSRIFEIGSYLSYIIPGRAVGGISLSRVFFNGPSLLKVLYRGEVKADSSDGTHKFAQFASSPRYKEDGTTEIAGQFANIGSGNLAMNLASKFFNQPVGLGFFFKDQSSGVLSQIYFEGCYVSTLNLGISANMNVLTEAVNMEFIRCRPIVTSASSETGNVQNSYIDLNVVSTPDTSLS